MLAEQAYHRKQASLGAAAPAHPASLHSRINKQPSKQLADRSADCWPGPLSRFTKPKGPKDWMSHQPERQGRYEAGSGVLDPDRREAQPEKFTKEFCKEGECAGANSLYIPQPERIRQGGDQVCARPKVSELTAPPINRTGEAASL